MLAVDFSKDFLIYPNDPDLWLVYSDFLEDLEDLEGASHARQQAFLWQEVALHGWRPFFRKSPGFFKYGHGWAWANSSKSKRGRNYRVDSMFPSLDNLCNLPLDLFECLPDGDYDDNSIGYWIVTWKTEEGAWWALKVAWQKWRNSLKETL